MNHQGNKISQFWQELKRRKVIKVIAMYAATAFIIMEAAEIMLPRLGLPDWTVTFIVILLVVGFPIVIILSWIFDVTPDGIKKTEPVEVAKEREDVIKSDRRKLRASDVIIAVMVVVVLILVYPKIFRKDKLASLRDEKGRISVAVMPFQNMTNDTTWNVWQDAIQDILISSLSNSEELTVRQSESVYTLIKNQQIASNASITHSVASTISRKLDANVFIQGNIKQAGLTTRLYAQLIDANTEEVYKSFQVEGTVEEDIIFNMIDSISMLVKDFLILSEIKKGITHEASVLLSTSSPEAYRYFKYGFDAYTDRDYPTARDWFMQAIGVDSNFTSAGSYISTSYLNQGLYEEGKKWCLRVNKKRESMPLKNKILTDWLYACFFESPYEEIEHLQRLNEIDDQLPMVHYLLGRGYSFVEKYDKAIPEFEKSLEIYDRWGIKVTYILFYTYLGNAYHKTGEYGKERRLYNKAKQILPDDPLFIFNQAVLSLSKGRAEEANETIEEYISVSKERSASEAEIASSVGHIYAEAEVFDKAEEYYRKALSLEPENPVLLNGLARFLIDKNIQINEGLELIDKALESSPDTYYYLDTKGWGLYKMGKYQEALAYLEKSWELKSIYDHDVYLHLEEVKKAIASRN
jgi:tetratricopeptide (TPR) repeat protein